MTLDWSGAKHPAVSRREILRRQIDSAIWIFAVRDQAIVANMLANASIDVMRSLAKEAGKETFKGNLEAHISPEHVKLWREYDRRAYNFSKHAERDPAADLEGFDPEIAAFNIMACCADFGTIFGTQTWSMALFRACELAINPGVLKDGEFKEMHLAFAQMVAETHTADRTGIRQFLKDGLETLDPSPETRAKLFTKHVEPSD